jgi:hypothetical protein
MPSDRSSRIKVKPVKKEKPDVRALARLLIELAISDASEGAKQSEAPEAAGRDADTTGAESAA